MFDATLNRSYYSFGHIEADILAYKKEYFVIIISNETKYTLYSYFNYI